MFGLNAMNRIHPLDKLITDDSLWLLESMVAFVDYPFKRMLVMLIKYKELMSILNCLDDRGYISKCGFDCHPKNSEDMINDMCNFMPGDFSSSIKNMNKMMSMMNAMNSMNNDCQNHGNFNDSFFNPFSATQDNPSTSEDIKEANSYYRDESDNSSNSSSGGLYESVLNILDNN